MLDTDTPKGYDCRCCKKRHEYPAYVFAHRDEVLTHECDECEATHEIFRGQATMTGFPVVEHDAPTSLPDNVELSGGAQEPAKSAAGSPSARTQG